MLNLSLAAVAKGNVQVEGEVFPDDSLLAELDLSFREPLRLELEARPVGEGVLVRGRMRGTLELECRRCVGAVLHELDEPLDILYEPLDAAEEEELAGEVYPLPPRGDDLDLRPALREQILLRVPEYVECSESCRGLCPQCGTNLNQGSCECVPEEPVSAWDALKKLKFD